MLNSRANWGIVKLSSIGDVVHALPVAAAIRRALPRARIEWIVESPARDLVENSPVVDKVLVLDRSRLNGRGPLRRAVDAIRFLGEVRSRCYDVIVDLQGLLKSGVIALASGASERYGYEWLREGSALVVKPVPARAQSRHIVDKLLDVVRYMGIDPEPVEFPIGLLEGERAHVDDELCDLALVPGRYIVLNPCAAWPSKEWPPNRFAELADRIDRQIGVRCLFLGAESDSAKLDQVRGVAASQHVYLAGAFNLREYAEVCRRAAGYVGGDTGPTAQPASCPWVQPIPSATALTETGIL